MSIELIEAWLGHDIKQALFIVANLIVIESLLSVDNAAVIATMVMDLKDEERKKALRYGIIGAYVFRGICLVLAAWLMKIWWLKPLGGLYLLYLAYDYFTTKETPTDEDDTLNKNDKWFYRMTKGLIGNFWATVIAVEVMDLAFSLDNVFAAVAYTDSTILVMLGVFIGILAMRFVATYFVTLLERYPFLQTSAFLVIGVLGLKLTLSVFTHFYGKDSWAGVLDSEAVDWAVSLLTAGMFIVPILTAKYLGWPKYEAESNT
jgi:YkoY family integral membrane protein